MQRRATTSSAITEIGYENGVLEIKFVTGKTYRYFDVPELEYDRLMKAESKGAYFNANIRGQYKDKPGDWGYCAK